MNVGVFSLFRKIAHVFEGTYLSEIVTCRRLYKFIDRILKPKGMILIIVQGNKMYVNGNDIGFSHYLLINKIYERETTELFKSLIHANMCVVDIGANMGYYTLIAAKLMGKGGKVYSFEPEPKNYKILVKNIEINDYTNIRAIQKAISNKEGKIKLFVNNHRSAVHSLSEDNVQAFSRDNVQKKMNFVDGVFNVETTTLDHFFENVVNDTKVDLIKMDVQGAEGLIVEGAQNILRNNNLKIIMAFWPYGLKNLGTDPLELLHKLKSYGFKIKYIAKKIHSLSSLDLKKLIKINAKDQKVNINLLLEK